MSAPRPSTAVKLLLPVVALVASAGVTVAGALWTSSANATLTEALTTQTGTAADVYGSQSAIVASSALLSAGIIGIVVSLAALGILIALGAFTKPEDEVLADEFVDEGEFEFAGEAVPAGAVPDTAAPAAQAAAPVTATPAAGRPVDQPIIATSATESPDVPATPTEAPAGDTEAPATDTDADRRA
jgi:hypothetical protein